MFYILQTRIDNLSKKPKKKLFHSFFKILPKECGVEMELKIVRMMLNEEVGAAGRISSTYLKYR